MRRSNSGEQLQIWEEDFACLISGTVVIMLLFERHPVIGLKVNWRQKPVKVLPYLFLQETAGKFLFLKK